MKLKDFNIYLIIISFIISLSLLITGHWLYKDIYVNNPLTEKLEDISAIKEFNFMETDTDNEIIIDIELKPDSNLKNAYLTISNVLNSFKSKNSKFKINIQDYPNDDLIKYWEQAQFSVYQALEKGDYTSMSESLKDIADNYNFNSCKIDMDNNYIYIQINDNNYSLYKIIQRN